MSIMGNAAEASTPVGQEFGCIGGTPQGEHLPCSAPGHCAKLLVCPHLYGDATNSASWDHCADHLMLKNNSHPSQVSAQLC